jgi:hypothetical protein
MIVYPVGEYCEIDGDVYEVLSSGWNPESAATWTMVLLPCDGRTHAVEMHDTKPVMRRNGLLPPKPVRPAPAPEYRELDTALKAVGVGESWLQ